MHILRNLIVGVTAGAAVISSQLTVDDPPAWDLGDDAVPVAAMRLETASSCADLTDRVRAVAARVEELAEENGYSGGVLVDTLKADATFAAEAGADMAAAPQAAAGTTGAAREVSGLASDGDTVVGTNVQEVGVDETDIIKTDGRTIYVLREGTLVSIDADTLKELDTLKGKDQYPYDLLLSADRVILFESAWETKDSDGRRSKVDPGWDHYGGQPILRITTVDITDPSDLNVDSVVEVDGSLIAARMVDGYVRVVTSSAPQYGFPMPVAMDLPLGSSGAAPEDTVERLSERIDAQDVLPSVTVQTRDRPEESFELPCDQVHIARDAETLETTTVFSLDPLDPKPVGEATAMTGGGTVYANTRSIYVARQIWARTGRVRTEFHRFDITDPLETKYVSAGRLGGYLLNQFSMSEHEGRLRVASTDSGSNDNNFQSESKVTIFEERGDRLIQTGSVGGLGLTEQIFAVRFIGNLGYVVTFRQTDPLYVIDLSDPTAPLVTGELKIPGYSAYLHPIGEGYLIGVGQDANEQGRTKGVQVSLFDVRDPANPKRIAQLDKLGDYSSIEHDHRAFQYLPDRNMIIVPASSWREMRREGEKSGGGADGEPAPEAESGTVITPDLPQEEEPTAPPSSSDDSFGSSASEPYYESHLSSFAYLIEVTPSGLREVARITHRDLVAASPKNLYRQGELIRAIAIGSTLYTLSDAGLSATYLDSTREAATLPW